MKFKLVEYYEQDEQEVWAEENHVELANEIFEDIKDILNTYTYTPIDEDDEYFYISDLNKALDKVKVLLSKYNSEEQLTKDICHGIERSIEWCRDTITDEWDEPRAVNFNELMSSLEDDIDEATYEYVYDRYDDKSVSIDNTEFIDEV